MLELQPLRYALRFQQSPDRAASARIYRLGRAASGFAQRHRFTAFADAERARVAKAIENPTKAWIEAAAKAGYPAKDVLKAYMEGVRKEGGKFAREWDKE